MTKLEQIDLRKFCIAEANKEAETVAKLGQTFNVQERAQSFYNFILYGESKK
jgi:hypothetical protein